MKNSSSVVEALLDADPGDRVTLTLDDRISAPITPIDGETYQTETLHATELAVVVSDVDRDDERKLWIYAPIPRDERERIGLPSDGLLTAPDGRPAITIKSAADPEPYDRPLWSYPRVYATVPVFEPVEHALGTVIDVAIEQEVIEP